MESHRFYVAACCAVILIFTFFSAAMAATDISPTPNPQTGAGSVSFVPSFASGLVGFVVALFACYFY